AQRSKEILMSCGARIRQMHDRGVYHADLQLKNIFVADTGIFLLDFDGARVVQGNVSPLSCARNLLRLQRSFEKLGYPPKLWQQLLDGYGNILLPLWLRAGYRVKAGFSDMMQGRRTMQV
ncbi:MAG: hypothetical protein KAH38_10855, partial [Candidatus Hydrogenedentes bacterium]|nr:hypothetical protein [Candidatus Hydrogenedentota bacterium]